MKKIGLRMTPFTPSQIEKLREHAGRHAYELIHFEQDQPDLFGRLAECEALMGAFEGEQLMAAKAMKWLHVPSAGVERYLRDEYYAQPDALLSSSSGAFGIAISEYMICGLLMIQRRMPQYQDNQKQRLWKQYPGISTLYGSRVTVVGVGDLGTSFAMRCHALGSMVTGVRRSKGRDIPACYEAMYTVDQIDEALRDADVVGVCLPATEETVRLFDANRLRNMKPGAIIINVGRGSALDPQALNDALRSGHLGGALLDVTDPEPLPKDSPLWDCPNAVITPHVSGIDRDELAASIVYDIYSDNLHRYLTGQPLVNVIDRKRGY